MQPIGPLAIILRHTDGGRRRVPLLAAASLLGILGGLALLIR